jgi:dynein assembly factor with WDR repeat domains 1
MKLKKFLLRYYPPGIILEYIKSNGETEIKSIDLLNLNEQTNVEELVDEILEEEPLIPPSKKHYLVSLIDKLVSKVTSNTI